MLCKKSLKQQKPIFLKREIISTAGIRPVCSIEKNKNIKRAVYEALSKIELPDLSEKRILLKPNVGRNVGKNLGINTSPDVVEAVFYYLREKYPARYYLGDSPITGVKSREAFVSSGYQSLMDHEDIVYIDLDDKKPIHLKIPGGRILKAVKVSGYFHNFDYVISIPVLKMHMHTGATLSFKNMKGLIYKKEKVKLHQLHCAEEVKQGYKELDIAIADLSNAMAPDLVVIDAYYALEGMGPSAGDRKKLDTIIASTDFLAADLTALAIVNLDIDHVPHLKLIAEKKNGLSSINDIQTIPADISPFRTAFKTPPTEIKINNCKVNLLDVGSCSACLSSIFEFIKNNEPLVQEYFDAYGQLNIAVGKDIPDPSKGTFICGNCSIHRKNRGVFIKGCPPTQSSIKEMIENNLNGKH